MTDKFKIQNNFFQNLPKMEESLNGGGAICKSGRISCFVNELRLELSLLLQHDAYDDGNHHVYYQRSRPIWLHHRLQKRPVNHKNHEFFSLLNWPWTSKKVSSLIKYNVSAKIRILKDLKRSKEPEGKDCSSHKEANTSR